MVGNTRTEQFTNLRLDNYSTARYIGFTCGSFMRMSLHLLGMTIELTYKQLILESQMSNLSKPEDRLIKESHDLEKLHQLCLTKGLLTEMTNYEDFLSYANLFYKTRYPIHVTETMNKLKDRFRNLGFSIANIFPYDEFICELDFLAQKKISDYSSSIIYQSLRHINNHKTLSIFHCNYFAFNQIDDYVKYLDPERPDESDSIEYLNKRRKDILKNSSQYLSTTETGVYNNSYKRFKENYIDPNW